MDNEGKRCFLYVLKEDGLHLYKGRYRFCDYGWGEIDSDFKSDGGETIDLGGDYDPTINVMNERDDESVRSEMREYLQRSIDELQKQLSALENEIILETKEDGL